jgi:hypothetical protein
VLTSSQHDTALLKPHTAAVITTRQESTNMTKLSTTPNTALTASYDDKINELHDKLCETDAARRDAINAVNNGYAVYLNAIEDEMLRLKHDRNAHVAKLAREHDNWLNDPELFAAMQHEATRNDTIIENAALNMAYRLPLFSEFTPDCGANTQTTIDHDGTPHSYIVPALWIAKQTPDNRIDALGPVMDEYFIALYRAYGPITNKFNRLEMAVIYSRANGPRGVWTVTKDHEHGPIKLERVTRSHGVDTSIKFNTAADLLRHIKQHMS